jgi:hypothetical protein
MRWQFACHGAHGRVENQQHRVSSAKKHVPTRHPRDELEPERTVKRFGGLQVVSVQAGFQDAHVLRILAVYEGVIMLFCTVYSSLIRTARDGSSHLFSVTDPIYCVPHGALLPEILRWGRSI